MDTVKQSIRASLSKQGLAIQREFSPDMSQDIVETIHAVRHYTMTTVTRIEAVCSATEYIVKYGIPGRLVIKPAEA